jgi:hypothetical protein
MRDRDANTERSMSTMTPEPNLRRGGSRTARSSDHRPARTLKCYLCHASND